MKLRFALVAGLALLAGACSDHDQARTPGRSAAVSSPLSGRATPAPAARFPTVQGHRHRFAAAPDRGALVVYPKSPVTRRDGAYTSYLASISEAHARDAIGGTLTVPLPTGEQLRFRYARHVEHPSGDWTWIGEAIGSKGQQAIITFGEKAAFGTIGQAGEQPWRLTVQNGASWLIRTDGSQVALINNSATRPTEPDYIVPPAQIAGAPRRTASSGAMTASSATAAAAATSGTASNTVDLVIGYTPGFVTYYGGDSQAQTRLNNMVDITNQAYVNSGVDARVRLVKTLQVSYADNTTNDSALEGLTGFKAPSTQTTPDPAFSALRAARDQYGADLVSLVRRFQTPENEGCGIAWLIGGAQSSIDSSDGFFGYSVVSDGRDAGTDGKTYYCREETLAHELGHNMGAQHDRTTAQGDNGTLESNEYGRYPYSFGYKTTAVAGNFYTVMAYGDSGQTTYRIFSNPRSTFCGGLACGIENQADNARTLSQTIPTIATFRATKVSDQPAPVERTTLRGISRDVNGDGKADFLWSNPATGELYYWLMDGGAVRSGAGGVYAPASATASGAADFNGDARMDVVLTSANDIWVYIGNGYGGFSSRYVASFPQGWTLAGLRDLDADGKDDFIWFNPTTGELYYWLMDGGTIRLGRGGVFAPANAGPRGVADFNGDGHADIVLASTADIWIYFGTSTGGFASGYVATVPSGWTLVGPADMNADAKADFVWHHPVTGEIYYWLMSGSSITAGRGGVAAPDGSSPLFLGDYNGDRRADIAFGTSTNIWTYITNTTGGFNSFYTYTRPTGWTNVQ